MRRFTYLIHGFKNLTISYFMLIAFVVMPVWAGDYQSKRTSEVCSIEMMNEFVKKWLTNVQSFKTKILPDIATRGGEEKVVLTLFPLKNNSNANFLAGKRKVSLTWNGGQKPYRVKMYTTVKEGVWRTKEVWSQQTIEEPLVSTTEQEFKNGEYWVVVEDANDQPRKGKIMIVDKESAPFFKQLQAIEKNIALDDKQKRLFMVVLLLGYGKEWKLEAYQQIANQKDDEFSLAKLGIEHQVPLPPISCSKDSSK